MNPRALYDQLVIWLDSGGSADPYVIQTSGSSGEPKKVLLSRAALLASATATQKRLGGPGQWLLALPVTAVAGLQVLVRSVLAGTKPVILDEHDSFAAAVGALNHSRKYTALVPTQLHRLLREGHGDLLREFDAILIGGAGVSPALLANAKAEGLKIVRTYGMTETSGGCVYDGVPLDGVEVELAQDGRIKIAGPVLFEGYVGQPQTDKWFVTEDLGEFNEDGNLRVIGRVDDVVISGGVNVALPAVTNAVLEVPGVIDAQAFGIPDEEWGTKVVAAVVGDVELDAVRAGLEQFGLPRSWAPQLLLHLADLPKLSSGKTDRQKLRELIEQ